MLSEREFDVLVCIHAGMTKKETARAMGLSPRTISAHTQNLFRKLDLPPGRCRRVLAALAYERGEVPPIHSMHGDDYQANSPEEIGSPVRGVPSVTAPPAGAVATPHSSSPGDFT